MKNNICPDSTHNDAAATEYILLSRKIKLLQQECDILRKENKELNEKLCNIQSMIFNRR